MPCAMRCRSSTSCRTPDRTSPWSGPGRRHASKRTWRTTTFASARRGRRAEPQGLVDTYLYGHRRVDGAGRHSKVVLPVSRHVEVDRRQLIDAVALVGDDRVL